MLSICITVKNRSQVEIEDRELLLFPNCVRSIVESTRHLKDVELVVADWDSDDWPLSDWLDAAAAPVPVRMVTLTGPFSRGRGLNKAVGAAAGNDLLFTDADSLLSRALIDSGLELLRRGKAFFPVLYSFDGPEHRGGWWRHTGFGNCMVTREMHLKTGGWPEYQTWGKEDEEYLGRISAAAEVVREEVPGFYHQWHPDDVAWKSRYGSAEALEGQLRAQREEQERIQQTLGEIQKLSAPRDTVILVNENQWPVTGIQDRRVLPFLEHEGQYWGQPEDDAQAISELERMRKSGARYIAFAWPAFWWLEHYGGFHRHLRERFTCVAENEDLIIFDISRILTERA